MSEEIKDKIADHYWDLLLEHGQAPASVFKFCKELEIKESEFYKHYPSFEAIEGNYWKGLVETTVVQLEMDEEAREYDARQKLLAFYFTFIEHLLDNRSRFTVGFPSMKDLTEWRSLKSFDRAFKDFAEKITQQGAEEGVIDDRKKLNDCYPNALLLQFKVILEFYRNDHSHGFQDTDAFIEKSVRFFFDGVRLPLIDSGLDLIRFLVPRMRQH